MRRDVAGADQQLGHAVAGHVAGREPRELVQRRGAVELEEHLARGAGVGDDATVVGEAADVGVAGGDDPLGNAVAVEVVDSQVERRHQVAEKLRASGLTSMEAATPLEAIAMVERARNHVAGVAVADTLTQTGPHELAEFLSESNPNIEIAMFVDEDTPTPTPRGSSPNIRRHGSSDELASALARTLRRERP